MQASYERNDEYEADNRERESADQASGYVRVTPSSCRG
jgi:hypothetical protein